MKAFADQHRTMLDLADGILSAVKPDQHVDFAALSKLRLQLSRSVSEHVSAETALFQRQPGDGSSTGNPRDNLIARYHDELLIWRSQLINCNVDWPPARIRDDQRGFLAAFMPLRDALKKRVRWEEEIFYPGVLSAADLWNGAAWVANVREAGHRRKAG